MAKKEPKLHKDGLIIISNFRGDWDFLSNMYPCNIDFKHPTFGDVVFKSVEHGFQACKTKEYFEFKQILKAETPQEAKKLGREATLVENWDTKRIAIMKLIVKKKFLQNLVLGERLMGTGVAILIEGNDWNDRFWGMTQRDGGENHLGKILMEVRKEIEGKPLLPF